jgi:hypothetical protein
MVLLSLYVNLDFPNLGGVKNYLAFIVPYYFSILRFTVFVELANSYEIELVESSAHLSARICGVFSNDLVNKHPLR